MTTTEESWANKLARDVALAEQILTTRGGLNPMFIVDAGGRTFIAECKFTNPAEKQAVLKFVQLWAVSVDADAVTSLAAAWLMTDPARQKVVIATAVYRDGDQRRVQQKVHLIEHNERGHVTGLGLNIAEATDEPALGGDFINLLPGKRPGAEQRAHAQAAFDDLPSRMRRAVKPTNH